jgi:hypothetical protein
MSQLNSLLESASQSFKNLNNDAARLAKKWSATGLLEGLSNENERNSMSMLLENQAKQLVLESNSTNQGGATFSGGGQGEQWNGIALPLVRKVFGQISSKEFVSLQTMNMPSGLVFYLDFQYGQSKRPNFGPSGDVFAETSSLYGNTNPGAAANPAGGMYGAGRFGYSINQFKATVTSSNVTTSSADWVDVDYDAALSASIAAGDLTKITIPISGSLTRPDLKGVRAFSVSASTANPAFLLPAYTSTDGTNITFVFASGSGVAQGGVDVYYNQQPVDNNRGDFEDVTNGGFPNAQSQTELSIPSIDVKMKSEAIVAKTRKLKAQWTPEFAQDLNAYQALDAEAELTSIMSEYISMEIDLEILDMLIQDASGFDEYWNASNNQQLNAAKTGYDNLGFYNTQGQWFQTLGTKLQKVSNKIHTKTMRGGANFMVISPTVATIIESIPGFASNADGDAAKNKFAFGIQKMGQMNSRYDVYKNPYMSENVILMGYRGSQFLEAGAVFAPYVPLIQTPLVYDPDTFTPRKGMLTRYAKKMIRPEYYGRVFVSNTELV